MDELIFWVSARFDASLDKWVEIEGPGLSIRVDYDDVDHNTVEKNVKKMLKILNENWEK